MIRVAGVARLLLPRESFGGGVAVLGAYFDDSGTHADSEIVVMACLIAPDNIWTPFESAWKAKLREPLPGKPPLTWFHMVDCVNQLDEFMGYNTAEVDAVIKEFRDIILSHDIHGSSIGVARQAYDDLVSSDFQSLFGDPFGYCVRSSATFALKWARNNPGDHQATMIFDNGPQHIRMTDAIVQNLKMANGTTAGRAELFGPSFLPVKKFMPLQAVDILAWETYNYGKEFLGNPTKPIRLHYKRMIESNKIESGFHDRETIDNWMTFIRSAASVRRS